MHDVGSEFRTVNRRKGPPKRNPVARDLRRGERIAQRLFKALHITREFAIRCLEALTVEFCILCILRASMFAGATGIAVLFSR